MTDQKRALIFASLAVLCWSSVATAFKLSLQYVTPLQLVWVASLISTLFLLLLCGTQRKWRALQHCFRFWPHYLLLGALNPLLYYLVLFEAYARLPAQQAQALNYTWAITLALLSVPVLGHRLNRFDGVALILGYLGALVIATQGSLLNWQFSDGFGVFMALTSTLIWAGYWLLNARRTEDPVAALTLCFLCGLPMVTMALWLDQDSFSLPWQGWLGGSYIGLFEMGVTFVLWLKAMKLTKNTSQISNLIFLSPFLSLLFIYLLLGEAIHPATPIGLAMIILGVTIQRRGARSR